MFFRLLVLFTVIPVVELYLLIRLGTVIGAFATITLVIGTGVLGAALSRMQGFAVLQNIRMRTNRGEFPAAEMIDGLCILIAGVVLLTPGILTDILGFLLLLPPTRAVLKRYIGDYLRRSMAQGTVHFSSATYGHGFNRPRSDFDSERVKPAEDPETVFIDPEDVHDDDRGADE